MKIFEHYFNENNGEQRIDILNEGLFHIVYIQERSMSVITIGEKDGIDKHEEEKKALKFTKDYLSCIEEDHETNGNTTITITETGKSQNN